MVFFPPLRMPPTCFLLVCAPLPRVSQDSVLGPLSSSLCTPFLGNLIPVPGFRSTHGSLLNACVLLRLFLLSCRPSEWPDFFWMSQRHLSFIGLQLSSSSSSSKPSTSPAFLVSVDGTPTNSSEQARKPRVLFANCSLVPHHQSVTMDCWLYPPNYLSSVSCIFATTTA